MLSRPTPYRATTRQRAGVQHDGGDRAEAGEDRVDPGGELDQLGLVAGFGHDQLCAGFGEDLLMLIGALPAPESPTCAPWHLVLARRAREENARMSESEFGLDDYEVPAVRAKGTDS
jgi:hypothetical protein